MTAAGATLAGRTAAESLMVDSCTIGTLAAATFDSTTGTYTPGTIAPAYTGKCRVQVRDSLNASEPDVGERQTTIQTLVVSVPVSVTGLRVDQVVQITASALDPDLVGKRYRIVATHAKTHATARRLQCEELTGVTS